MARDLTKATVHPPSPRLVGVEPNPGPPRLQKKKSIVVIRSRPRKRRTTRHTASTPLLSGSLGDYIRTLEDPWEHGPVPLGFGTLLPTTFSTAYKRSTLTVNADGSFALMMFPQLASLCDTNVSGAAGTTWTAGAATNYAAIQSQMSQVRIISAGLRCMALYPSTSRPGVLFAGTFASQSLNSLHAYSPTLLSGLADAELGFGGNGARFTLRPTDLASFNMNTAPILSYNADNIPYFSSGYIAGLGFPSGTVIWYEAIMNFEGFPVQAASAIGLGLNETPAPGLSDRFPSMETAFSAARTVLGNAVVLDGVSSLAETAFPSLTTPIRAVRSMFGHGRNMRQSLVAGASSSERSAQSSVVIEEMKEDSSSSGRSGRWLRV